MTCYGGWHHAHLLLGIIALEGYLVMIFVGPHLSRYHLVDGEIEYDGLLQPFVHMPVSVNLLGNAQLPTVQHVHNVADCFPDGCLFQQLAVLPRLLY